MGMTANRRWFATTVVRTFLEGMDPHRPISITVGVRYFLGSNGLHANTQSSRGLWQPNRVTIVGALPIPDASSTQSSLACQAAGHAHSGNVSQEQVHQSCPSGPADTRLTRLCQEHHYNMLRSEFINYRVLPAASVQLQQGESFHSPTTGLIKHADGEHICAYCSSTDVTII